jgi:hypothetical protein
MDDQASETASSSDKPFQHGANARPVLIAVTTLALVAGPILILEQLWPDLPWRLLLLFLILIAVQSALTAIWLKKPNRLTSSTRLRVAELLVIIFLLRLYTWLITNSFPQRSDILLILRQPELILDSFFVVAVMFTLFVALRSQGLTKLFAQLSLDRSELPVVAESARDRMSGKEFTPVFTNRQAILQRYYMQWAIGGAVLIICAAISTFDYDGISGGDSWIQSLRNLTRLGISPEMLIALLAYFLGGLLLASEGRLAMLNARWTYDGVKIEGRITKTWRRNSLILLVIIALTAIFIPIGSTVDISGVFQAVTWIAIGLMGLLGSIFAAIYWVIYSLLMRIQPSEERTPLSFEDIVPEVPQVVSQPSELLELILGSAIWVFIIAAIVVAAIYLVRNRGLRLNKRLLHSWWRRFVFWLRIQWQRFNKQIEFVGKELRSALSSIDRPSIEASSPWRFIRLRSLSPRERVRYFYLSTVKRAGERGVERDEGETPSEYIRDLKAEWPGVSDEIDELTDAFIKARYSPQSIQESDVEAVKPFWQRIRSALKR